MEGSVTSDRRPFSCVLFDLDGTLLDSAGGVIRSIERAFVACELTPPGRSELRRWLGPPMVDNLRRAGLSEPDVQEVLARYRADYDRSGVLESTVFSGVPDLLDAIDAASVPMAVASSKPQGPADLVLVHLGIAHRFASVAAADPLAGRNSKADCIRHALHALEKAGADIGRPVVVGDRHHDVDGARAVGIESIFVTWGYGERHEAEEADFVIEDSRSLRALLVDRRSV